MQGVLPLFFLVKIITPPYFWKINFPNLPELSLRLVHNDISRGATFVPRICDELESYRCMVTYRCKHLRDLRAQDITPKRSCSLWIIPAFGDVLDVKDDTPIGGLSKLVGCII